MSIAKHQMNTLIITYVYIKLYCVFIDATNMFRPIVTKAALVIGYNKTISIGINNGRYVQHNTCHHKN